MDRQTLSERPQPGECVHCGAASLVEVLSAYRFEQYADVVEPRAAVVCGSCSHDQA